MMKKYKINWFYLMYVGIVISEENKKLEAETDPLKRRALEEEIHAMIDLYNSLYHYLKAEDAKNEKK